MKPPKRKYATLSQVKNKLKLGEGESMKQKEDWEVLRDFYLYSDLNDEHAIDEYLHEKQIDIDEAAEELKEFLRSKLAELKLAQGRKFKEEYLKALNDSKIEETEHENEHAEQNYSFAFRKGDDGDDDFEKDTDDEKKIQILKNLTEKNKQREMPSSNQQSMEH